MLLRTFTDRSLAQNAYLIASPETGEALVIDPPRDVSAIVEAARAEGVRITHVTETHIHADFCSGARELAHETGARLLLSGMGGDDWQYTLTDPPFQTLRDGDRFQVGRVGVEVLHTPGHTPEHLVFVITDEATTDRPLALISGDMLFVGDIGRPDLLETAAGVADSAEDGARDQFGNVQHLRTMPDYLQVLPGHGAGSVCGKALSAIPSSTLGYEKLVNPAFAHTDQAAFVRWLLDGQAETPRYFAYMKQRNRTGAPLLRTLAAPPPLEAFILPDASASGVVIDARPAADVTTGHVPGTIHIPPGDQFAPYAGWFVDYDRPTYLIADARAVGDLVRQLRAIGVDDIRGVFAPEAIEGRARAIPQLTPTEAADRLADGAALIDVRGASEAAEERIAGALPVMFGQLPDRLDEIPRDRPLIAACQSGVRSLIAATVLRAHGFEWVSVLQDGLDGWKAAGLPTQTDGRRDD